MGQCPICENQIELIFWHFYPTTGEDVMVYQCTYCTWLYVVIEWPGGLHLNIVE